jgi:pimeloyl-ACP methyl ester carboxylesterase
VQDGTLAIDTLEAIEVGNSRQWIRIRGADASNPVLLLIQQGPGLPMINEARRYEQLLGLEQAFTVVYWDQRGCGRSLRGKQDRTDLTLDRMVSDTVELLELLRQRVRGAIHVAGFSLGAALGAFAATRRPDLVTTLVAVGTDVDGAAAAHHAYSFALAAARERGNRRAIRQLTTIGPPPHLTAKQFSTRARWVMNFDGVTRNETYASFARALLVSLVRSSDYSAGDLVRTFRGMTSTQAAMAGEVANLDLARTLPRIGVPVVLVQGRLDHVAPVDVLQQYAEVLEAPSKRVVWFERSAHTPQLDEPDTFRDLLLRVRDGHLADLDIASTSQEHGGAS